MWHFYQVFFDPDVYPMNGAWWDGKMPVERTSTNTHWILTLSRRRTAIQPMPAGNPATSLGSKIDREGLSRILPCLKSNAGRRAFTV
jgi:hypothetical protein